MKILIIKPSSFGDIVQANPTLTALRALYPSGRITWLVFDQWAEIVALFPDNDRILAWNRQGGPGEWMRLLSRIRSEKFDLVIDLQGLARTALLAMLSGAKKKVGVPGLKEGAWLILPEAFPGSREMNAVTRSLETVRYLGGGKVRPRFRVAVTVADEKAAQEILKKNGIGPSDELIALIPFSRGGAKQWPAAHYEKLVTLLRNRRPKRKIVVFGSAGDAGKLSSPGICDLSGKTTLRELAGILKYCRAAIGGDTGPLHLAAAMNVPVVALFGGSDMRETSPVTPRSVLISRHFPCSPCRGKPTCQGFPCLSGITPEEVFEKASALMKLPDS
ncbi:MAG: glycosyltransferase family 9 protein [Endomicrobiales bacterium]